MLKFYIIILLLSWLYVCTCQKRDDVNCSLPSGCHIGPFYYINDFYAREFLSQGNFNGFICDVTGSRYQFDYDYRKSENYLCSEQRDLDSFLELRFRKARNMIVDVSFNIQGVIDFLIWFKRLFVLHISNVRGFDLELGIEYFLRGDKFNVNLIKSKVDFYSQGKLIESCQDLRNLYNQSNWSPNSLFQLKPRNDLAEMFFLSCKFR